MVLGNTRLHMADKLKNIDEMVEENKQGKKRNSSLYKIKSAEYKGEVLSNELTNTVEVLKQTSDKGKVDFDNIDEVKKRTFEYLNACAIAECFPSVMGLAVQGYGVSRQYLNRYIANHDNATADFIRLVKDEIADLLVNASLQNNANPIMAIFQLKNHYEHSDKTQIEVGKKSLLDNLPNINDVMKKYESDEDALIQDWKDKLPLEDD